MKVIADGEDSLAGRGGRHVHRLEALVVTEGVGDAGEGGGSIAVDKTGDRATWTVRVSRSSRNHQSVFSKHSQWPPPVIVEVQIYSLIDPSHGACITWLQSQSIER